MTIVHELHTLLDKAGVPRPFIYAAHSAGGLYVREYAREYPNELAGVALINASSPNQIVEAMTVFRIPRTFDAIAIMSYQVGEQGGWKT